jgi:hypothetical protein
MSVKVQKGKEEELGHHGIKLVLCDALARQPTKVPQEDFITMKENNL